MVLPGLGDFKFNASKEMINGMAGDGSDTESVQKISKTFMKGREEKAANSVYPVDWINSKGEKEKGNIMINSETFMGNLFIKARERTEGTWFYFKDPLKQKQTLLYQGDTFELDSVQYIFEHDTNLNNFTIVKFSNSTTAKNSQRCKQ